MIAENGAPADAGLSRSLAHRHVTMISIGGIIGAGVFGTRRQFRLAALFAEGAGFPLIKTKMSASDALALHAYLIDLQWKAFNGDR